MFLPLQISNMRIRQVLNPCRQMLSISGQNEATFIEELTLAWISLVPGCLQLPGHSELNKCRLKSLKTLQMTPRRFRLG